MDRRCRAVGAVAATILVSVWVFGKKHPKRGAPFELRTQTQLVNLTIVATDHQGGPVTNLKASDIVVREDGKRQTLLSFEPAVKSQESSPSAPENSGLALAAATSALLRPETFRYIAFVMDDSSTHFADLQQSIQAAAKWIRQDQSPSDQVALFSLGLGVKVWQPFTANRRLLLRQLAAMAHQSASPSDDDRINDLLNRLHGCMDLPELSAQRNCAKVEVRQFYEEETALLVRRTAQLRALAEMLGLFPGEKRVIYFGDGFLTNPGRLASYAYATYFGTDREMESRLSDPNEFLRPVTDAALRSDVTFYTIDAHGLRASPIMGNATQVPPNNLGPEGPTGAVNFAIERQYGPADSLNELAWDTGGLPFSGDNDLAAFAKRAIGDIVGTYYASYQPTNTRLDGSYRKITIRSLRRGVRVHTRAGYYAVPIREFPVRAKVLSLRHNIGRYLVPVEFSLDRSDLHWHGRGSRRNDELVVAHTLVNADHHLITSRVQMLKAGYPAAKCLTFAIGWNLAPGQYRGVVQITESGTSDYGVANFSLNVP
jgi:VWFA-related protein